MDALPISAPERHPSRLGRPDLPAPRASPVHLGDDPAVDGRGSELQGQRRLHSDERRPIGRRQGTARGARILPTPVRSSAGPCSLVIAPDGLPPALFHRAAALASRGSTCSRVVGARHRNPSDRVDAGPARGAGGRPRGRDRSSHCRRSRRRRLSARPTGEHRLSRWCCPGACLRSPAPRALAALRQPANRHRLRNARQRSTVSVRRLPVGRPGPPRPVHRSLRVVNRLDHRLRHESPDRRWRNRRHGGRTRAVDNGPRGAVERGRARRPALRARWPPAGASGRGRRGRWFPIPARARRSRSLRVVRGGATGRRARRRRRGARRARAKNRRCLLRRLQGADRRGSYLRLTAPDQQPAPTRASAGGAQQPPTRGRAIPRWLDPFGRRARAFSHAAR